MIKHYAFQLGRIKELCLAELMAVHGAENLVEENNETAIFKLKELENPHQLQDKLGGTIKIIELFAQTKDLEPAIEKELLEHFKEHSGKIPFAISLLNFRKHSNEINIKKLLNFSKIIIKSIGLNCRFVNFGNKPVKPSTIFKARVIKKGIDLNIIKTNNGYHLGRTISIQNINSYSKRDYDKPFRDAKVGMTPPKLAQIMINLAGETAEKIYDPFCGTGTYLMEGMLMGKEMIGSDIDERMVKYTEGNCQWLTENFKAPGNFQAFQHDARFITQNHIPETLDAIVTEGYLGKPVLKLPSPEEREKTFRELENLHLNWLKASYPLLKKNGKVIMCAAAFKLPKGFEHMPRFDELIKIAGYKISQNYIYDRADQIVAREIFVLEKI